MQLRSSTSQIPDGLLAAMTLLSEKPHQGVPSRNLAPHQGIDERNSTAALGLRASEHLNRVWSRYTGKERDTESGNDYFGARYYGSSMGRFRSPDWSSDLEAVPYASLGNPQSLNLYSYVQNNPLKSRDPDGHMHQECDAATYSYTTESTGTIHVSASQHCYGVYDLQDIRMMAGMALGHHGIPRSLFRFLPKGPARTWLEREFTTGPLDGPHYFDTAHRLYNKEVEKLLDLDTPEGRQELIDEGLDGVKKAAQRVLDSDNPNIKEFLDDMETPDGLTGRQALEGAMEGDAGALVDVIIDGAVGLAAVE